MALPAASELVGTSVLGAEAGWLVDLATQMQGSRHIPKHGGLSRGFAQTDRELGLMNRLLNILRNEDELDVKLQFDELAHRNLVFRNCFLTALHDDAIHSAVFSRHTDRIIEAAWDAFASVGMGPAAMAGYMVINAGQEGKEEVIKPFIHIGDYCSRGWVTGDKGCDDKLVFRDGWHLDAGEKFMPLKLLKRDANVAEYMGMDSVAQMCEKGLGDPVNVLQEG